MYEDEYEYEYEYEDEYAVSVPDPDPTDLGIRYNAHLVRHIVLHSSSINSPHRSNV